MIFGGGWHWQIEFIYQSFLEAEYIFQYFANDPTSQNYWHERFIIEEI